MNQSETDISKKFEDLIGQIEWMKNNHEVPSQEFVKKCSEWLAEWRKNNPQK